MHTALDFPKIAISAQAKVILTAVRQSKAVGDSDVAPKSSCQFPIPINIASTRCNLSLFRARLRFDQTAVKVDFYDVRRDL